MNLPSPVAGDQFHTITLAPSCFTVRMRLWFCSNLAKKDKLTLHFPTEYCSSAEHPGILSSNLTWTAALFLWRLVTSSMINVLLVFSSWASRELISCQHSLLSLEDYTVCPWSALCKALAPREHCIVFNPSIYHTMHWWWSKLSKIPFEVLYNLIIFINPVYTWVFILLFLLCSLSTRL